MTDLRPPPVPADLDLSKLDRFMHDTARLIGSELVTLSTSAGLIRVRRYQSARVVEIVETGKHTAEPAHKRPHWRASVRGL